MSEDPYPFEADDDIEIRELDVESVDAIAEARITVSQLAHAAESWRYGHVIVDEAQDLTPMQWRMVMRRVRGQSLTIVGDLAQRSLGTAVSGTAAAGWEAILPPELSSMHRQDLTVNYRSPAEIHALAVAVLAEFAPSIAPSTALRTTGISPAFVPALGEVLTATSQAVADMLDAVGGQVAIIAEDVEGLAAQFDGVLDAVDGRLRLLTPNESKGLEFDGVVLVEPAAVWRNGVGAAELYIALTRATQQLTVVHQADLPVVLQPTNA